MNIPTPQQVQEVIDNLSKILPQAHSNESLDMMEVSVRNGSYDCGTVHCHAGWYAVARLDYFFKHGFKGSVNYTDGIDLLCKDLGFRNKFKLAEWLGHIDGVRAWGNDQSLFLFKKKSAFYHPVKRPEGAKNLQHIIDHWIEVKERLVQMENLKPHKNHHHLKIHEYNE